jgi:hypothetical protein
VVITNGDVVEVLDAEADTALDGRGDFKPAPADAVPTTNTLTLAEKDAGAPVEAAPAVPTPAPVVPTPPAPSPPPPPAPPVTPTPVVNPSDEPAVDDSAAGDPETPVA